MKSKLIRILSTNGIDKAVLEEIDTKSKKIDKKFLGGVESE